jgi:hypothetical protein
LKKARVFTAALVLFLSTGAAIKSPAQGKELDAEVGLTLNGAAVVLDNLFRQTWQTLSRARLQAKLYLGARATFEGHYQATLTVGPGARETVPFQQNRLRGADIEPEISSGEDYRLLHDLDRLWLNLDLGWLGLGLGRQVIGHGQGRFFNPTDIFGPLPILTTYSEYKNGVDAVRLTHALERGGEIEVIGVAHRDGLRQGIGVLRTALEFKGWGFSAYGGYSQGRPTFALALSGDLGPIGWYSEGFTRLGDSPINRGSAGLDYRFSWGLEVLAETHYNGSGASRERGYDGIRSGRSFLEGEIFLVGRWYSALHLGYEITPLIKADMSWLQNYGDGSAMLMGVLIWDLSDKVMIRAGVLAGLGRETRLDEEQTTTGSEFGDYGTSLFVEVRLTF